MANTPNHVLLERITVGAAGASSVTFANIPQTGYTDLKIEVSAKSTDSVAQGMNITFNSSSSTFSGKYLLGNGASASSGSLGQYVGSVFGTNGTANTFNNTEIYIPNYSGSQQKSFSVDNVAEANATTAYGNLIAGLWATTSAISSIGFSVIGGASFVQYSTFSLYALAAVGTTPTVAPYAIGGDIIQTDGTYWYHAFINSGYFTPNKALSCDVLVVAGGGGGGGDRAGGGGAGGVFYQASNALTANSTQTVTIGAGGAIPGGTGSNGGNSIFGSLTAIGGGGGAEANLNGVTGGSGGGSGSTSTDIGGSARTGGSSTSGQGYAGGGATGTGSDYHSSGGGGGGGAGGAGGAGSYGNSSSGYGGVGTSSYSSWLSATSLGQNVSGTYYIAGGGGGGFDSTGTGAAGAGGNGGGGAGGVGHTSGTAGTSNTGGGGGGGGGSNASFSGTGGAGGSGVIIVRYAI